VFGKIEINTNGHTGLKECQLYPSFLLLYFHLHKKCGGQNLDAMYVHVPAFKFCPFKYSSKIR